MGIRRIMKTLGARWWIVLLIAIAGAIIGMLVARNYNDNIVPRWRAEAPVTFIQLDESDGGSSGGSRSSPSGSSQTESASVDVADERARAELLLEDTLAENDKLAIKADRTDSVLYFIAVGRDGQEAIAAAVALRDEYETLGATVLSIEEIQATMATLLVDIERIKSEIAALEVGEVEPEDGAVTARRNALQSEIDTLNLRQAQLRIWIANPELRPTEVEFTAVVESTPRGGTQSDAAAEEESVPVTVEALTAELETNDVVLVRLARDLALVPDPPEVKELDSEATLEIEALTLDLEDFQAQYVDLLRRTDGRPPGGFPIEPTVIDETASEVSESLAALLGFLAGGILAAATLIAFDRGRNPIWAASDVEGTVSLGVVDRDRSDAAVDAVWYPTSVSQRRRDIQALRAATDAVTEGEPAILGIIGVDVHTDEIKEIAADLAAAYTVAGHNALVIEGSGYYPNTLPEFGEHNDAINRTLSGHVSQEEASKAINEALDSIPEVIPCLTAIHIGSEEHDPIDAFASPNCRVLMDAARARFDVIILAGPDLADPLADAVAGRTDYVVLVGWMGHTKISQIEAAADVLADRRTNVAGTVLLTGKRQTLLGKLRTVASGDVDSATSGATRRAAAIVAGIRAKISDRDRGHTVTIGSLERLDSKPPAHEPEASVSSVGAGAPGNASQDSPTPAKGADSDL
jgi:hypothetical protein